MALIVYSKDACPQCTMLEGILSHKGIVHTTLKMDKDFKLEELMESFDQLGKERPRAFPIVFKDGEYIGSVKETKVAIMKGSI